MFLLLQICPRQVEKEAEAHWLGGGVALMLAQSSGQLACFSPVGGWYLVAYA